MKGMKLLGTRSMSDILQVHRKTVIAAYEELDAQGWVETIPNKGTFVIESGSFKNMNIKTCKGKIWQLIHNRQVLVLGKAIFWTTRLSIHPVLISLTMVYRIHACPKSETIPAFTVPI